MKLKLSFLAIIIFLAGCNKSKDEPRPIVVHEGDITLVTQQDVDDFADLGITELRGSLTIGSSTYIPKSERNIINLDGFKQLTLVEGNLHIFRNHLLNNIDGLTNIAFVGWTVEIFDNESLTNLDGLKNLSEIGGSLMIEANYALSDLDGLTNLTTFDERGVRYFNPKCVSPILPQVFCWSS